MKRFLFPLLVLTAAVFIAPVKVQGIVQYNGQIISGGAGNAVAATAPCQRAIQNSAAEAARLAYLQNRIQELIKKIAELTALLNSLKSQGVAAGDNANNVAAAAPASAAQIDTAVKDEIFAATNREREKYLGVGRGLKQSAVLDKIAADRVRDMFENQYFSHTSGAGVNVSSLAKPYGYFWRAIGENIAYGPYKSGGLIVGGWMASAGHKANILSTSFTEIGVGAGYGNYKGRNVWIAVQIFGNPG